MRIVLLILLASTASLALTALLVRPEAPFATAARQRQGSPAAAATAAPAARFAPAPLAASPMPLPATVSLPLTERMLSASQRSEPIEAELREAIDRIEPVMDPTRLDGPFAAPEFRIWPGTASLADVFGEHWRLASLDPNVQRKVRSYASGWNRTAQSGCDDFVKNRPHPAGSPSLSALSVADCEAIRRRADQRRDDAAPVPIVAAPVSLAVFAAPPPGARMSSREFWAAQKERMAAMRERLQRKWQAARADDRVGLRE